jgi:hypothetical protein
MTSLQAAPERFQNWENIPRIRAAGRANAGLLLGIVIPVVVGSSPISHPK